MTTLLPSPRPETAPADGPGEPLHAADVLVVGGAILAPLNLLLVRSFTAYDLLIAVAFVMLAKRQAIVWPRRRYLLAAYVFLVMTLLSAFRALQPLEALTQTLQYVFVFFIQIPAVFSVVTTRRRAVWSLLLLCLGTLGAIAHAYLVHSTQGAGRVLVFYSDNPNRLGYPAAYLVPLLLALWVCRRRSGALPAILTVAGLVVALSLSVWAVFASGSRSSLLGTAVATLVFVVLRPGLGLLGALRNLLVLVVACVALGAGLTATGQLPGTLEERIFRSLDTTDPAARAHLVADRENLMDAGISAFEAFPWLGVGLDNFRYVTPQYDVEATPQLPHNLWLQLLVQVGLIGTLAFVAYLLVWAWDAYRAVRRAARADVALLWGLVASVAGVLTIFMFAPEMLDRHYWLLVALGMAVAAGARRTAPTEGP